MFFTAPRVQRRKVPRPLKGCSQGQRELAKLGQGSPAEQDKAAPEPNLPFSKLWVLFTMPCSLHAGPRVNQAE